MLHAKLTDFQESPSIGQIYIQRNTTTESMEEIQQSTEVMSALDEIKVHVNNEKQEIGQYWKISNGGASLHVVVMEKDPCMVHFYKANTDSYLLNASSNIFRFYENILLKYFHTVFSYFVLVLNNVTMPYKPELFSCILEGKRIF